jgi:hypothetical protein
MTKKKTTTKKTSEKAPKLECGLPMLSLIATGKELNEVLNIVEDAIKVKGTEKAMLSGIKEATFLIEPEDVLTQVTIENIQTLGFVLGEEEEKEEEKEEEEKTPIKPTPKKTSSQKKAENELTEKEDGKETKTTPKKSDVKGVSASYEIGVEIAKNPAITMDELLAINAAYLKPLSKNSVIVFRANMRKAIKILKSLNKIK